MNNPSKKKRIERAIIKINPKIPSVNFIKNYKDFLKVRNTFIHYNFNSDVLENLIDIAYDLYIDDKRFDKSKLFGPLKSYYSKKPKNYNLPEDSFEKVFNLFKLGVSKNNIYVIQCANLIISNHQLSHDKLVWLLNNKNASVYVLNRVLRYPFKSKTVFDWAFMNFEEDKLRGRRAELVARILNYKPDFILKKDVVIKDFEYLLECDVREYMKFKKDNNKKVEEKPDAADEVTDDRIFGNPFEIINEENIFDSSINNSDDESDDWKYKYFSFKNERYFKRILTDDGAIDINTTREIFMKEIDKHYIKTRIWAIYYSFLEKKVKEEKLKELYHPDVINSMIYVATKMKSIRLLKWLQKEII